MIKVFTYANPPLWDNPCLKIISKEDTYARPPHAQALGWVGRTPNPGLDEWGNPCLGGLPRNSTYQWGNPRLGGTPMRGSSWPLCIYLLFAHLLFTI